MAQPPQKSCIVLGWRHIMTVLVGKKNINFFWETDHASVGRWEKSPTEDMNKNLVGWDYVYIYIYAQTGTFADPTVRRFELFFPFEAGVRFFREISRSIFFLRFQPIKCIRLKSIWRANRTCSCITSNTILFKCCQHGVKYVPKQSIP